MSQGQERQRLTTDRILAGLAARVERLERKGTPAVGGGSGGFAYGWDFSSLAVGAGGSNGEDFSYHLDEAASVVAIAVANVSNPDGDTGEFSARLTAFVGNGNEVPFVAAAQLRGTTTELTDQLLVSTALAVLPAGDHAASYQFQNESSSGNLSYNGRLIVMTFQPSGSLTAAPD